MDTNRLAYLAKKYVENINTDEEQQELAALVQKARENAQLKKILQEIWETYEPGQQMPGDISNRILSNLFTHSTPVVTEEDNGNSPPEQVTGFFNDDSTETGDRSIPVWKYISIAASFTLVFLLTWWLVKKEADEPVTQTHLVSTQKGSRSKLELPDGTTVWLNAGSQLEYADDFDKSFRKVSLTGEAFFDVFHNKEKPFIIHTTSIDLRVLGTTFNVRAYPEEKRTEASLITGMLEVSFANQPTKKILLKPSEKISVNNEKYKTGLVEVTAAAPVQTSAVSSLTYHPADSSVVETSWVNNKLVFRNKPFEEVAMEMSRWYDVDFEFRDNDLMKKRFTGTFATESIYEALTSLSYSYNFTFTYDKARKVFIIDK